MVTQEMIDTFLRACIGYVTDDDDYRQRVKEGLEAVQETLR